MRKVRIQLAEALEAGWEPTELHKTQFQEVASKRTVGLGAYCSCACMRRCGPIIRKSIWASLTKSLQFMICCNTQQFNSSSQNCTRQIRLN